MRERFIPGKEFAINTSNNKLTERRRRKTHVISTKTNSADFLTTLTFNSSLFIVKIVRKGVNNIERYTPDFTKINKDKNTENRRGINKAIHFHI